MSNWFIESESFKFYKLRSEDFVKIIFVALFALRFIVYMLPLKAPDINLLYYALDYDTENFVSYWNQMLSDSWPYFLVEAASSFAGFLIMFWYALVFIYEETIYPYTGQIDDGRKKFVLNLEAYRIRMHATRIMRFGLNFGRGKGSSNINRKDRSTNPVNDEPESASQERENLYEEINWTREPQDSLETALGGFGLHNKYHTPVRAGLMMLLGAVPKLLVTIPLLAIVYGISPLLMGIPFLFVISAFMVLPLYLTEKTGLRRAFHKSYQDTKGLKIFILSKYFIFSIFFMILQSISGSIFSVESISWHLLDSLIFTLKTLIYGRFLGLIYLTVAHPEYATVKAETITRTELL